MSLAEPASDESLRQAFRPASVAILGAASNPARISGRPLHYMLKAGYAGRIYPVNNRHDIVQGLPAFKSLADLPETPDVALIALAKEHVLQAVVACVDRGIRAAVIFAAGFAEASEDGKTDQEQIAAIARRGGLRLFGPNCLGIFHSPSGFIGTFTSALDNQFMLPGRTAVISQSGAYGGHLAYLCRKRNLGVSYWASTGNEADIDVASCIEWLARQDDVATIMAYAEGIRDGEAFVRALETAHRRRKPVIFGKVGDSIRGAEAASSHTASLAGSSAAFEAIIKEYGVYRARTTEEHVDVAYACSKGIYPAGRKVGIVTVSGGFGIQLCDSAERNGLEVPPLPTPAQERLAIANPHGGRANPCDTTSNFINNMDILSETFDTMHRDGGYDAIVAAMTILPGSTTYGSALREAIAKGTSEHCQRPTLICMEAEPEVLKSYDDEGLLTFPDSDRAIRALAALTTLRERWASEPYRLPVNQALAVTIPTAGLSEADALALLAKAGIPCVSNHTAQDPDEAVAFAQRIGYPVVMKIVSPDIPHKSEIGGVLLNIGDDSQVRSAMDTLRSNARSHAPEARVDGVLIAESVTDGIEVIIGAQCDPVFGPMVMFGLGGIYTEVFNDVVIRPAPCTSQQALEMIRSIRGYPLISGARGQPPGDINALAEAITLTAHFIAANAAQLASLDLNPVVLRPAGKGVVAIDAFIKGAIRND